jgi:hypothetical protein
VYPFGRRLLTCATVGRVPAFNRVGPRRVLGERATAQQLGVVVADRLIRHGVRC